MTTAASTDAHGRPEVSRAPTTTEPPHVPEAPRVGVTVRYFAGAAEAAGTASERVLAATAGELRATIIENHGAELARVLDRCTLLADGVRLEDPAAPLAEDATVDVLPPFAGG